MKRYNRLQDEVTCEKIRQILPMTTTSQSHFERTMSDVKIVVIGHLAAKQMSELVAMNVLHEFDTYTNETTIRFKQHLSILPKISIFIDTLIFIVTCVLGWKLYLVYVNNY